MKGVWKIADIAYFWVGKCKVGSYQRNTPNQSNKDAIWQANCFLPGSMLYLGMFETTEEAEKAVENAVSQWFRKLEISND